MNVPSRIVWEDLSALTATGDAATGRDVLAGEIEGLRTRFYAVPPGSTVRTGASEREGRVYIFVSGRGALDGGDGSREIDEIVSFTPRHNTPFDVSATGDGLRFLELVIDLSDTDLAELADNAEAFPMFLPYSACKTYREAIKSEKTVNRTLLAEHTFPRLCMGSVETTGDDCVGAHEHPMLEQLFYGLKDNDCVVSADDAEHEFRAGHLLHIPLGSSHGVEVRAPNKLHYVWIDLFRDREGMNWILEQHISDEE